MLGEGERLVGHLYFCIVVSPYWKTSVASTTYCISLRLVSQRMAIKQRSDKVVEQIVLVLIDTRSLTGRL